jgi:hypothetical protein
MRTRARLRSVGLAVCVLTVPALALAGCTGSASGGATGSASSSAPALAGPTSASDPSFPPLPGFAYVGLPPDLVGFGDQLTATGLVDEAVARGVARTAVAPPLGTVMLLTYTPAVRDSVEKLPLAKLLDSVAVGAKGFTGGTGTVTTRTVAGEDTRLVQGPKGVVVVTYRPGGHVVQVVGPTAAGVLAVAEAYLSAT